MTRFGKIMTVVVLFCSASLMAFASASFLTREDYKGKVADLNDKIPKQTEEITALTTATERLTILTKKEILAQKEDVEALEKRTKEYAASLEKAQQETRDLYNDMLEKTKASQAKLDEVKLRRQDVEQLKNQLEELRAQREISLIEQKRLRDLLIQTRGALDRVERRRRLLEGDGARVDYDTDKPATDKPAGKLKVNPNE